MRNTMNDTMQEAMRLMRLGDLQAATAAIQRGLSGHSAADNAAATHARDGSADWIEGDYRIVPESPGGIVQSRGIIEQPDAERSSRTSRSEFRQHHFACGAGSIHYKLFIPAGLSGPAPLVVMLHGCTQSPDDFACGTRMNTLAQEHGYVIAYPAQTQKRNPSKCWNWFRTHDQQRGRGEPAIIAALTRHLVQTHRLDERRVYAAGLSAGGAMASVLASTYPDVYAAIGVHSGLPHGVARDLPSAFAAMKQQPGMPGNAVPPAQMSPVPVIVFHGDRDPTVDPRNASAVIAQCTGGVNGSASDDLRTSTERGSVPGGRAYTRTIYKNREGSIAAEQWVVHGGGHAWFGGDPAGSYADPAGPDASQHMLRFFSGFVRSAIN
jgi:poly(hydroxyalkanoate) depolymerase family esterase